MEYYPPLVIPPRRGLTRPLVRPFNVDKDCVLCLIPEIDTKWRDQSQYLNHGTIVGATKAINGRRGQSIYFDGTDDYIDVTDQTELDLIGDLSVFAWINPSSIAANSAIVSKGDDSWELLLDLGKIRIECYTDTPFDMKKRTTNNEVSTGNWQHVGFTRSGNTITIYHNATTPAQAYMTAQNADPMNINTTNVRIGVRPPTNREFTGYIDEVILFSRLLAVWEITALYQMGKPN